MRRRMTFAVAWVLAAALAATVGVLAVVRLGSQISDRGPIGEPVDVDALVATPSTDPGAPAVQDEISGDWGTFVVACRDTWAYGVRAEPDRSSGWRVVNFEPGPDDDVDAVFSNGRNSVDLEVFCNRGRPTVAEIERNTLGDD